MTCNITRPDPQTKFNSYKSMFETTVLNNGTVVAESDEWYLVALMYAMSVEYHAIADQSNKERDERTMCEANLIETAARRGVYPKPATAAQGYVVLTGTAGTTLTAPLSFTINGVDFVSAVNSLQPTTIGTGGNAVIQVRAVTAGTAGNVAETTGTMTSSIAGVDSAVVVCNGGTSGGTAPEAIDTTFRTRFINRKKFQPVANQAWMVDKFTDWPGVTRALPRTGSCCSCGCNGSGAIGSANSDDCSNCGCANCGGQNHYYIMFDNDTTGLLNHDETLLRNIQTWMFGEPQGFGAGQAPIGTCGRICAWTAVPSNVTISVSGCPSAAELAKMETITNEFFTTVSPSQPVSAQELQISILQVTGVPVTVTILPQDDSLTYGEGYGDNADSKKVFYDGCALHPDCDYMITLGNVSVYNSNSGSGGCV